MRWIGFCALFFFLPFAMADKTLITNVTLVDAVNGARADQQVLVEGGKIVSVTDASDVVPDGVTVVDGDGQYLMPGLWDMHVHFLYDTALTEAMPGLFLDYGITSVRDTGGDIAILSQFRAMWRQDPTSAPRIYIAGPLLDGEKVVYDGGDPGRPPLGTDVPDKSTASLKVIALKAAGADFIKTYELVSPEVFAELVSEAKTNGLPIASHVPLSMTADIAGPQVNSMEHLRNVELACAENWQMLLEDRREIMATFEGRGYDLRSLLHKRHRVPAIKAFNEERCKEVLAHLVDTIQVPTLGLNTRSVLKPSQREEWQVGVKKLPQAVQQVWQEVAAAALDEEADPTFTDWSFKLVAMMAGEGVPIGAGTDTPIGFEIPGESLHYELELLVRSGLSHREALYAATVRPAEFFGIQETTGQIVPGMNADLVLLSGNPLDDIRNTRLVQKVMLDGRWVR